MSDVDLQVEAGADLLNHPNTSEIGMGVQSHQRLPHSIRNGIDHVGERHVGSAFERIFWIRVFTDPILLGQDTEFIVEEVGDSSDRVDRRCGIVVFGASADPGLNGLRILIASFHLLYLQSALRCVSLVDATRRQLTAPPTGVLCKSTYHDASTGIPTGTNAGNATRLYADFR